MRRLIFTLSLVLLAAQHPKVMQSSGSFGTGVQVSPTHVLTAAHVVSEGTPKVVFPKSTHTSRILKTDKESDLALLEISPPSTETSWPILTDNIVNNEPSIMSGYTGRPTLIHYTGPNCPACTRMEPVVSFLRRNGHKIITHDFGTPSGRAAANAAKVTAIPTFVITYNGSELSRIVGVTDQLQHALAPVLNTRPSSVTTGFRGEPNSRLLGPVIGLGTPASPGDSGGPVFVTRNGDLQLAGIISTTHTASSPSAIRKIFPVPPPNKPCQSESQIRQYEDLARQNGIDPSLVRQFLGQKKQQSDPFSNQSQKPAGNYEWISTCPVRPFPHWHPSTPGPPPQILVPAPPVVIPPLDTSPILSKIEELFDRLKPTQETGSSLALPSLKLIGTLAAWAGLGTSGLGTGLGVAWATLSIIRRMRRQPQEIRASYTTPLQPQYVVPSKDPELRIVNQPIPGDTRYVPIPAPDTELLRLLDAIDDYKGERPSSSAVEQIFNFWKQRRSANAPPVNRSLPKFLD